MTRLVIARTPVDGRTLREADSRATALVVGPATLAAADSAVVDVLAEHRAFILAVGEGTLEGHGLAAGLLADVFAVGEDAVLRLDSRVGVGDLAAGLVWRIGPGSFRLLVEKPVPRGDRALEAGLADEVVPLGADPLEWAVAWFGARSLLALQSGARLVRMRGGDVTERAEFARLFAAGEPQEGLGRFLDKEPLDFSERTIVETI